MRKIYFLLLFVCTLLTHLSSIAQTNVIIPATNSNSGSTRFPLGTYWGYERAAMIYAPGEFGGVVGQITAVSFYVNSLTSPGPMTNVRVYLKTRSDFFTTATTYASETSGLTASYGPTTTAASALTAGQWYTITLATPFTYNGTENLEVIVETNFGGTGSGEGSASKQFRYTTQADESRMQAWADDTAPPSGTGTLSLNRPNVRFTVTESPCVTGGLTGGTVASTTVTACAGANFTLSVSGASSGGGLTYQWESSPDNATWSDIPGANSSIFTTTTSAATYYRRKLTCSGTDAFSTSVQVTVAPPATLPIVEDFANFATLFPSACWSSNSSFLMGNASSAYGNGLGSAQFGFYNTGNTLELATPAFTPVPANYRITFDHAYATFIFGEEDALEILYSTDGGATYQTLVILEGGVAGPLNTGGVLLGEFLPTSSQWASKAFALPTGTNKILFRGLSQFGNNLYLDNINIEETPPCLPPTNLNAAAISPTQHQISWSASPSAPSIGYQWEVRTSGAAGSGATGLAASGSTTSAVLSATATGLTANTSYRYYVRAYCEAGLFSSWTLAGTFITTCDATNIPYTQNFDNAVSPNFPACVITQDLNGGGSWGMWYDGDIVTSSTPNAIRYAYNAATPANDWFFIQGLNLEAGKTYTLSFKYKASDGPNWVENLEVKYGNAPNAAAMTSAAIFNETNIATNVDDPFATANVTFTVPSNGVYYIGFRCYSDADMAFLYIDDISVESCAAPASVTALSTLPTNAVVSFVSPGSSFVVEYGPAGFVPGTGATAGGGTVVTGTSSPITLTGLTANTLYDIYVRQNCVSASEFSGNTRTTVRTLCASVNVPYTQDFTGVSVPSLPTCVSLEDVNGAPTWHTFTPNAAWGFNGTALRYLYDGAKPGNDWFYIQGLNLEAGKQYEVSYKYGATDPLYPERMRVALGIEARSVAMTTTLADYPNIIANSAAPFANLGRVMFTVPSNGAYYIGFQAYTAADQFQLFLDSIVVREVPVVDVGVTGVSNAPTCPANNLALSATLHNFNLNPIDFSTHPVTVTATITGTATGTVSTVVNSGTLAAGGNLSVALPAFSFAQGVYTIATTSSSADDGVASNDGTSQFVVVNGSPAAATFTPAVPAVCEGGTLLLSTQFTTAAPAPTTMPALASGAINQAIPDASLVGTTHTQTVSGIPAAAVVTGISVTLNATHTWNSDMIFTLRAPNGRVLTLASGRGGSGDGYTNAVISSTGTAVLPSTATTPITGTFAPDGTLGVGATGFVGNASSFADLYSVGNGAWTLAVRDAASGDVGTLVSWSLTITYGQPHPVVRWTPVTGLFTDAAATVPYVANSNAYSVYVKPAGTTPYTVTTTSQFGCVTTREVTVTVNPNPVVNISQLPARICVSDPEVELSASPIGGSWTGSGISGNSLIPPAVGIAGTFPLTYRYTNNFGCTTTSTVQAKIEECPERIRLLRDDALVLFPNPNNGQFNVRINSTLYNKLTMRVYTTSGLAVRTQEFSGLAYGRVIPIDLTTLPSGSYMVQFLYFGGPRTSEKAFPVIIGR